MAEEAKEHAGRLSFADGSVERMDETQLTRVVYALTTLALYQAINHVQIIEAIGAKGQVLWRHPNQN
jgi:ribosomal protein L9